MSLQRDICRLLVDKVVGYQKDASSDGYFGDRLAEAGESERGQSYRYLGSSVRTLDGDAFHVWLGKWY